ncbi:TLD-domain-containing protein [Pisolithus thermaeus]|nr:TLD-domain-containing protein [Pisolithus croceorrhizus]KAI6167797.1 TLD-domain-containing protein [Pisolithus thermaeus]
MPPLIDFGAPPSSFISVSSSSATTQPFHPTRPKSHSPPSRSPYQPHPSPPKPPRHHLDESDIDRFATLFTPATPPATPTQTVDSNEQSLQNRSSQSLSRPSQHRRTRTESSADSDFGPFVSVPPHQDPLTSPPGAISLIPPSTNADSLTGLAEISQPESTDEARNVSLDYFGQFTTIAKVASERKRKGVLDELLEHQDDPLCFLAAQMDDPLPSHQPTALDLLSEEPELQGDATYTTPTSNVPVPPPSSSALSQEQISCTALPPRLSGNASPPSLSSPSASGVSLPLSVGLDKVQGSGHEDGRAKEKELNRERHSASPSQATLSRISSNLVSAFLSGTSKHARSATPSSSSTTGTHSSSLPTHSSIHSDHLSFHSISHRGSPFVSTPFIPPSGAPGFTGDRNWDKGFYDALQRDKESGTIDTMGLGGVTLCGRREGTLQVLTEDIANPLRAHLPALTRLSRNWTLLYSIDQHGISLNTLYSRCEPRIPSKAEPNPPSGALLVVKDSFDGVFGAWIGEGIVKGQSGFYGSGEAFLWRYCIDTSPPLEVYKWSGKNDYVVLCDPDFISFGGGDGHYGLYIDSSLLEGSSAPCPTFDNPVLCPRPSSQMGASTGKKDVPFECVGLEVWGIGPG